ncbi:MAG: hypothetical protein KC910_01595 [Candidatus Eremiobacteraeota bacterium]|nr:hypothetical protein [Candidatus Eremiobacteraeota bacterium]
MAHEINLKEAVKLSGKSEKTLRRKIEAGLLEGRREDLEYGGFMWLIDLNSLEELYPGSAPKAMLEIESPDEPPPTRLEPTPSNAAPVAAEELPPVPPSNQQFFDYLLEENRNLKEEIRQRDARITSMQESQNRLERSLGEQQGTAATQSRVLEWFQQQERPALPPGPQEVPAQEPSGAVSAGTGLLVLMALAVGGLLSYLF